MGTQTALNMLSLQSTMSDLNQDLALFEQQIDEEYDENAFSCGSQSTRQQDTGREHYPSEPCSSEWRDDKSRLKRSRSRSEERQPMAYERSDRLAPTSRQSMNSSDFSYRGQSHRGSRDWHYGMPTRC